MKSLSLSTPLVIITAGLPGAGKSFFARQFADMFRAPLISLDYLRFELFSEPTFSTTEQMKITTIAETTLGEIMKTKNTVLVDGYPTSRADRMRLEKLAKSHGYKTLTVWVQTDEATTKSRAAKRSKTDENSFSRPLTSEQYDMLAKRFIPPSSQEAYVVISGKHTFATQAKAILKKLTENRSTLPPPTPKRETAPVPQQRRSIIIG